MGKGACDMLRGKKQLKYNFRNKYWYSNASVECASLKCFVYKSSSENYNKQSNWKHAGTRTCRVRSYKERSITDQK
jgi:hypothetical protein